MTDAIYGDDNAAPTMGALGTGGALSASGVDPLTMMLLAQSGALGPTGTSQQPQPVDPGVASLESSGEELLGTPGTPTGALGRLQSAQGDVDQAIAAKKARIAQAMNILQGSGQYQVNLPALAAFSAMLRPTRTGSFGESIGNAGAAAVPAIQQQREVERQQALALGQLGVEEGETGVQGAEAKQAEALRELGLGGSEINQALERELYQSMLKTRENVAQTQEQGRLGWSAINAAGRANVQNIKSRSDLEKAFKPVVVTSGPTIQTFNPLTGQWTDTGTPTTQAQRDEWQQQQGDQKLKILQQEADTARMRVQLGTPYPAEGYDSKGNLVPGIYEIQNGKRVFNPNVQITGRGGSGAGSAGGVSGWKYNAWLAVHPGDQEGALDFVAGHKEMSPQDALKFGYAQAQRELGEGADAKDIDARAQEVAFAIARGLPAPPPVGTPQRAIYDRTTPKAPAQPQQPQKPGRPPAAPGAPGALVRPEGIPTGAKWSPSTKEWWWQDQSGAWQHQGG